MSADGIIFDIDHFAVHDGPGIRTVIYFKGCPLRCAWCHSPESQSKEPQLMRVPERCKRCEVCLGVECVSQAAVMSGRRADVAELAAEAFAQKVFYDASGGGVTLSGGEVLCQPEFAAALLEELRGGGIHTVIETSGMGSWEWLSRLSANSNIVYYDIKCLDSERHRAYTGAGNEVILDNLRRLAELRRGDVVLRVPLIPKHNDTPEEAAAIYELARGLSIKEVHLLRYNASAAAKYEWLGRDYKPGALKKQSVLYAEELRSTAPDGMDVTVY